MKTTHRKSRIGEGAAGRRGSGRGFTLLETVLALVMASLVVLGSLSLFGVLDRSQVRQSVRMDESLQLASAHKVVMNAMNKLLVAEQSGAPDEREMERALAEDDVKNDSERASVREDDAETARVALQPDVNSGLMMTVPTEHGERQVRSQTFLVTLQSSPTLAQSEKTEEQKLLEEYKRERVLQRALEVAGTRSSGSASRRDGDSSSMDSDRAGGRRNSLRPRSGRSSGNATADAALSNALAGVPGEGRLGRDRDEDDERDERTASERLEDTEDDELEVIRAPGVRGVFELLPDGQTPGGGLTGTLDGEGAAIVQPAALDTGAELADGPRYSLWWRELPPLVESPATTAGNVLDPDGNNDPRAADSEDAEDGGRSDRERDRDRARERRERERDERRAGDRADALTDVELLNAARNDDSSTKRVLLLSGLKAAHWTVLRGKKAREKITATYRGELPGYVELEIITGSGRREKWMFEVGWATGPEPGSVVPDALDPLNGAGGAGNPNPNDPNNPIDPNDPNAKPPPGEPNPNPTPGTPTPGTPTPGPKPVEKPAVWDKPGLNPGIKKP